ncbi:unnamed protein product [Haemonchus placei]|uniref:Secreted protein n=1 Tax=Haemonchus placei TaxID=6290 RepID=A0A0N4WT86_HAEPC|nr:unnamed protein product [Haemonchus placei]
MNCSHRWAVLHLLSPPVIGGTAASLERDPRRRSGTERTSTFHQDRHCLSLYPEQPFSKLEGNGEDDFCFPFHHPRHPKQMSLSQTLPAVIPHTLTECERQVQVDVCRKLLDHKRTVAWTSFITAQYEKWISYENPHRKFLWLPIDIRPEAVAKRGAHVKKNKISFFFCSTGCFFYGILP